VEYFFLLGCGPQHTLYRTELPRGTSHMTPTIFPSKKGKSGEYIKLDLKLGTTHKNLKHIGAITKK
jgi:hypothetical protein